MNFEVTISSYDRFKDKKAELFESMKQEFSTLKRDIDTSLNNPTDLTLDKAKKILTTYAAENLAGKECLEKKGTAITYALQIALSNALGRNVGIDGLFGNKSWKELMYFQKLNGLEPADGYPWPSTLLALANLTTIKGVGDILNEYSTAKNVDLCSGYVFYMLTSILNEQGKIIPHKSVDAREISKTLYSGFNITDATTLSPSSLQQTCINAPRGTIINLRFEGTVERKDQPGVSHAMISLGGGQFTDFFGKQTRTIDFGNSAQVNFAQGPCVLPDGKGGYITESRNYCTILGKKYIFTSDAKVYAPDLSKMDIRKNTSIQESNIDVFTFTKNIANKYNLPWEYVYTKTLQQNNLSYKDMNTKHATLVVDIPTSYVTPLKLDISQSPYAKNAVAKKFLQTLIDKQVELQKLYALTAYEYEQIVKLCFGSLIQESEAGKSSKYQVKENAGRLVDIAKWITGNKSANSQGLTQVKYKSITQNPTIKKHFDSYGISVDNLSTPDKSAIATAIIYMHNLNWLKQAKFPNLSINSANIFDYLPYAYNKPGELTKGTATPEKNTYVQNLKKYGAYTENRVDSYGNTIVTIQDAKFMPSTGTFDKFVYNIGKCYFYNNGRVAYSGKMYSWKKGTYGPHITLPSIGSLPLPSAMEKNISFDVSINNQLCVFYGNGRSYNTVTKKISAWDNSLQQGGYQLAANGVIPIGRNTA